MAPITGTSSTPANAPAATAAQSVEPLQRPGVRLDLGSREDWEAILFDLDGTLLPMDEDAFVQTYFAELAGSVAPRLGLDAGPFVSAVRAGTRAMRANDGTHPNAEAYWETFVREAGVDEEVARPLFDEFYAGPLFEKARVHAGTNPLAGNAVKSARAAGLKLAIASNPVFPLVAQRARMAWAGVDPDDFDLVTSYETSTFTKTDPRYFLEVCEHLGTDPRRSLMVGNAEGQDMAGASAAGLGCLLVTDWVERDPEHPWTGAQATFAELAAWLRGDAS